MGLNVGGNLITRSASVLTINTGSASMTMRSAGGVVRPKQVQFQAYNPAGSQWILLGDGVWTKLPFPSTAVNINSCFDTVNSRFTAPVTGMYFVQASAYLVKNNANNGYYFHPVFGVNGALSGRLVNPSYPNYRIRGYGVSIGTYCDGHITQVYELIAGDYVEYFLYTSGGGNSNYNPAHMRFTGFLLG